jgi:hypothetical protein
MNARAIRALPGRVAGRDLQLAGGLLIRRCGFPELDDSVVQIA